MVSTPPYKVTQSTESLTQESVEGGKESLRAGCGWILLKVDMGGHIHGAVPSDPDRLRREAHR